MPAKEPLLKSMVDALPDGALVVDPKGRVLAVNEQGARLCGLSAHTMEGQLLADLSRLANWLPPVLELALEAKERRSFIQEVEGRRLVTSATPLRDPDGLPLGVLGLLRDITELDRLQRTVERLQHTQERYKDELQGLRHSWAERDEVVAVSEPLRRVLELVERVARVDSTVLLLGESGAGKGVVARHLHRLSPRAQGPFIKVDCASIPESLMESELFGYESGAFTGARRAGKSGIIEQAQGGTLFLDEIAEVPLPLQAKLLQVIQERRFTRVGGIKPTVVDVRLLAGTHRDLQEMVRQGQFRSDLYYRLNVVPVTIPPLRERPDDIPVLARHFLDRFQARYRVERQLHPEVVEAFLRYPWPGNVRELENMIERLVVTAEGSQVRLADLPPPLQDSGRGGLPRVEVHEIMPLKEALEETERLLLTEALRRFGSTTRVGQALGIHQSTAVRKLQKLRLKAAGPKPGESPP